MTTVTDGSYRSRILGLLGERNPLESMEASAKRVEAAARKLGDGLSRSRPRQWTGDLAHLATPVPSAWAPGAAEEAHPAPTNRLGAPLRDVDAEAAGRVLASPLEPGLPQAECSGSRAKAVHPERGPKRWTRSFATRRPRPEPSGPAGETVALSPRHDQVGPVRQADRHRHAQDGASAVPRAEARVARQHAVQSGDEGERDGRGQ